MHRLLGGRPLVDERVGRGLVFKCADNRLAGQVVIAVSDGSLGAVLPAPGDPLVVRQVSA